MGDDDYYYYGSGFKPYVSAGTRRAQAARALATLQRNGGKLSPVAIDGRTIAATFWGKAWCDNLERYSDYANRLPRGRTYVRNRSVLDLQVGPGSVTALVSGSTIYDVKVTVGPVAPACWRAICKDCSGAIDSLVELLQGRLSKAVMARLCEQKAGLFPSPKDIRFTCSCPDPASMCKHVAAALYGIGARLDHEPALLFTLRRVDQQDLITKAGTALSKQRNGPPSARVLASDDLSELFGIEMAPSAPKRAAARPVAPEPPAHAPRPSSERRSRAARGPTATESPAASGATNATGPAKRTKPAIKRSAGKLASLGERQAVSARMREYWAARIAPKSRKGR